MHRLTWFRERYPDQPPLPVAERAGDEVLSLPLSPAHSDDDILDAVDAVRRVHARFTVMRMPQVPRLSHVKRPLRIVHRVTFTTLAVAYILLKIDIHQTWEVLKSADLVVVRARRRDHDRDRAADGAALAVAARGPGDRSTASGG